MSARQIRLKPALELIEDAVNLLFSAPRSSLAIYFTGTVPFVLALLFFWNEMSQSAYAFLHLPAESLIVALAFFWMKCWQSVFAATLLATARDEPQAPWNAHRIWRLAVSQTFLQSFGFFIPTVWIALIAPLVCMTVFDQVAVGFVMIPFALAFAVPLTWGYAFYQNATVLGAVESKKTGEVFRRAVKQSIYAPGQNILMIVLFALFSFIVFLNLCVLIVNVPMLLKSLLGIETVASRDIRGLLTPTLFVSVGAATYLCVDPILKAVYVLRIFYGAARTNGEDLLVTLKRLTAKKSVTLFLLFLIVSFAISDTAFAAKPLTANSTTSLIGQPSTAKRPASEISPNAVKRFEQEIREILQRPEFAWRMPHKQIDDPKAKEGFFHSIGDWANNAYDKIGNFFHGIKKWWKGLFKHQKTPSSHNSSDEKSDWLGSLKPLMWGLLALGAVILGFVLWRIYRRKQAAADKAVVAAAVAAPDLNEESLTADQLPEDRWLELAREMQAKGEMRLALRALYLAALAHLGTREIITIARFKSNREYERELNRRVRLQEDLHRAFSESIRLFEPSWYGMHEVTHDRFARFESCLQRIQQC